MQFFRILITDHWIAEFTIHTISEISDQFKMPNIITTLYPLLVIVTMMSLVQARLRLVCVWSWRASAALRTMNSVTVRSIELGPAWSLQCGCCRCRGWWTARWGRRGRGRVTTPGPGSGTTRGTRCAAAGAGRPAAADQAHRQEDEVPVPFRSQWDRIEAAYKTEMILT